MGISDELRRQNEIDFYSEEISQYSYDKILIMIQGVKTCIDIAHKLLSYNIDSQKIVLGINLYGNYSKSFDEIKILQNGEIQLRISDLG